MKIGLRSILTVVPLVFAVGADAQVAFPVKPIRIIVPSAPGGGADITTRLVAEKMSAHLRQPIIVENRPGGDGAVGLLSVKHAAADGYTLVSRSDAFVLTPLLNPEVRYNPLQDFTAIGRMIRYPMVIQVGPQLPDKSLTEFVRRAKAAPGQLTYATSGIGSPSHMALGMFFRQQNLDLTMVPYKGSAQMVPDVAAGRVHITADGYNSSQSYLNGGTMKPFGVTGDARIKPLPTVPTLKEQGYDYTHYLWLGMFAPAETPKPIIDRLSEALRFAMSSSDLVERFTAEGSTPIVETADEFRSVLKADHERMLKAVKDMKLGE